VRDRDDVELVLPCEQVVTAIFAWRVVTRGAYFGGGKPTEGAVGSVGVVLDPPCFDNDLGFEERPELFDVQEFVADAAVEALDVGVLPWAAGFDVTDRDAREPAPVA
jgi:hypothetical protein